MMLPTLDNVYFSCIWLAASICRDSVGAIANVVKIGYLVTGRRHNFHQPVVTDRYLDN